MVSRSYQICTVPAAEMTENRSMKCLLEGHPSWPLEKMVGNTEQDLRVLIVTYQSMGENTVGGKLRVVKDHWGLQS